MNRQAIRELVEDFWRSLITAYQAHDLKRAEEVGANFLELIDVTATQLPPIEAASFRLAVEAERDQLIWEYEFDPVALKLRLGLPLGVDKIKQQNHEVIYINNPRVDNMGDLIVRTAVRATIWEAIWALFRNFR